MERSHLNQDTEHFKGCLSLHYVSLPLLSTLHTIFGRVSAAQTWPSVIQFTILVGNFKAYHMSYSTSNR